MWGACLRAMLWLAVLASALAPGAAWAEGRVQLELVGERGESALAFQEWVQVLGKAGIRSVRLRSGQPTDRVGIEVQGSDASPLYIVTGIVVSRDELQLPGGRYRQRDVARLAQWLDDLAKNGPVERREPKVAMGLTSRQLEAVRRQWAPVVGFSTQGISRAAVIARIGERVSQELRLDGEAAEALGEDKIAEELSGVSCGTAMAYLLRPAGYCLVLRSGGQEAGLAVVKTRPGLEIWPVGWELKQPVRDVLPALMELHNVNIEGVSAATALEAIGKQLKAPVLVDHSALARHGIDLSQVSVKHPKSRTTYSIALRKILFQARVQFEVRVDEGGRPFLWVSTVKPV